MRVEIYLPAGTRNGGRVYFSAESDSADLENLSDLKGVPTSSFVFVEVRPGWSRPHNDVLGLCAAMIFEPFCHSHLELNLPVSDALSSTFSKVFGKTIGPVDSALAPRNNGSRQSLAFSGGIDSCVALSLLPPETVSFFLHRYDPKEEQIKSRYSADAALASCRQVEEGGREVYAVLSDLEYARQPVGFPTNYANAVPAIIHSDQFDLRSVNFGTVLESAVSLGKARYKSIDKHDKFSRWGPLFDAVGLTLSLPTAGLSEVTTSRIAASEEVRAWIPQSCVRGIAGRPCGKCFKCFRKGLMDAVRGGGRVDSKTIEMAFGSKEVQSRLLEAPIHHEIGTAYCISRITPGPHRELEVLRERLSDVSAYGDSLAFLERCFRPLTEYIDEEARDHVVERIEGVAGFMDTEQESFVRNWDVEPLLVREPYTTGLNELDQVFQAARRRKKKKGLRRYLPRFRH